MRYRRSRISLGILLGIAALLIAARVAAPSWIERKINARLDRIGDYHGHVEDVSLHLWRGAYELHELTIEKTSGKVPVPLLSAPLVDLSVSWRALFDGGIVATVSFENPQLSLVDGSGGADTQVGTGVDWRQTLEDLLPIRLDEVRINNGVVEFRNFISDPPVDLHATAVNAVVTNLTNVRSADKRPAEFRATAQILEDAPLQAEAHFDPFGQFDDFSFDVKVDNMQLPKLNNLLRAYLTVDVKSGRGDFVMQLDAKQGQLSGYAKPLLRDLDVIDWKKDRKDPLKLAWKVVAATFFGVFKNHGADQFGTRIPIEGRIDDPQLSTLAAIRGILQNAFVKAFEPEFEKIQDGG